MSALPPPKADIDCDDWNVRFVPIGLIDMPKKTFSWNKMPIAFHQRGLVANLSYTPAIRQPLSAIAHF
jgi:hypothetical protein